MKYLTKSPTSRPPLRDSAAALWYMFFSHIDLRAGENAATTDNAEAYVQSIARTFADSRCDGFSRDAGCPEKLSRQADRRDRSRTGNGWSER